jgi:hypothetical protein
MFVGCVDASWRAMSSVIPYLFNYMKKFMEDNGIHIYISVIIIIVVVVIIIIDCRN